MAENGMCFFVAGDATIKRPWSHIADPPFLDLIHDFEHPAQADSGGTWTASPPAVAAELKWAGIDMLAHANNHTTDYGAGRKPQPRRSED